MPPSTLSPVSNALALTIRQASRDDLTSIQKCNRFYFPEDAFPHMSVQLIRYPMLCIIAEHEDAGDADVQDNNSAGYILHHHPTCRQYVGKVKYGSIVVPVWNARKYYNQKKFYSLNCY